MKFRMNKEFAIGVTAVFLGLFAGAILMALTGNNPFEGYLFLSYNFV